MVIKTDCQNCGKKKAIKNKVEHPEGRTDWDGPGGCGLQCPRPAEYGGDCIIKTIHGCHKCGWSP